MLPTLRTHEYNYSIQQGIPQSYHQVLNITQVSNICLKYFWLTLQLNYKKSLRRLCPAQGFYNLISHPGSFCQILTELIISTISLGSSSKSIQTSGWPIRIHKPKYVTYVLVGNVGDKPLEGPRHPTKPPGQREWFISISNWDIHGLGYLQGGISDFFQLHKLALHRVSRL